MAVGLPAPRRMRGVTFIEILISLLILGVCLSAMVSSWAFTFGLSAKTDESGMAYAVGRRAIEAVRRTGFRYTPVGTVTAVPNTNPTLYTGLYTTTLYYDANGGSESGTQSASSCYRAATTVSTVYVAAVSTGTSTVYVPADDAVRTVTVTVTVLRTGTAVYQTGAYLVRSGV